MVYIGALQQDMPMKAAALYAMALHKPVIHGAFAS